MGQNKYENELARAGMQNNFNKMTVRENQWRRDLTTEGVEPNPGPPACGNCSGAHQKRNCKKIVVSRDAQKEKDRSVVLCVSEGGPTPTAEKCSTHYHGKANKPPSTSKQPSSVSAAHKAAKRRMASKDAYLCKNGNKCSNPTHYHYRGILWEDFDEEEQRESVECYPALDDERHEGEYLPTHELPAADEDRPESPHHTAQEPGVHDDGWAVSPSPYASQSGSTSSRAATNFNGGAQSADEVVWPGSAGDPTSKKKKRKSKVVTIKKEDIKFEETSPIAHHSTVVSGVSGAHDTSAFLRLVEQATDIEIVALKGLPVHGTEISTMCEAVDPAGHRGMVTHEREEGGEVRPSAHRPTTGRGVVDKSDFSARGGRTDSATDVKIVAVTSLPARSAEIFTLSEAGVTTGHQDVAGRSVKEEEAPGGGGIEPGETPLTRVWRRLGVHPSAPLQFTLSRGDRTRPSNVWQAAADVKPGFTHEDAFDKAPGIWAPTCESAGEECATSDDEASKGVRETHLGAIFKSMAARREPAREYALPPSSEKRRVVAKSVTGAMIAHAATEEDSVTRDARRSAGVEPIARIDAMAPRNPLAVQAFGGVGVNLLAREAPNPPGQPGANRTPSDAVVAGERGAEDLEVEVAVEQGGGAGDAVRFDARGRPREGLGAHGDRAEHHDHGAVVALVGVNPNAHLDGVPDVPAGALGDLAHADVAVGHHGGAGDVVVVNAHDHPGHNPAEHAGGAAPHGDGVLVIPGGDHPHAAHDGEPNEPGGGLGDLADAGPIAQGPEPEPPLVYLPHLVQTRVYLLGSNSTEERQLTFYQGVCRFGRKVRRKFFFRKPTTRLRHDERPNKERVLTTLQADHARPYWIFSGIWGPEEIAHDEDDQHFSDLVKLAGYNFRSDVTVCAVVVRELVALAAEKTVPVMLPDATPNTSYHSTLVHLANAHPLLSLARIHHQETTVFDDSVLCAWNQLAIAHLRRVPGRFAPKVDFGRAGGVGPMAR